MLEGAQLHLEPWAGQVGPGLGGAANWPLGDSGAAAAPASAAVLLLNAGHQLFLGVVVGDGGWPLGPLVAAAWGFRDTAALWVVLSALFGGHLEKDTRKRCQKVVRGAACPSPGFQLADG